ncbi:S8 family serine peptidase [Paenibacillus silviterrae]|uniref:S8 family serine peptidase n=1 Tax=Paenibacillus silviterrae TaxID=3242194 RepID=UPI0035588AD8
MVYKSNRIGSSYFTESGTSMATPICAGIVAQLLNSTDNLGVPANVQGRGYLNASKLLS